MRFYFTIFLILLVGFFGFRSCADRLLGGKVPSKAPDPAKSEFVGPPAPAAVSPSATIPQSNLSGFPSPLPVSAPAPQLPPNVSPFDASVLGVTTPPPPATSYGVYRFKNRSLPAQSVFSGLLGVGSGVGGGGGSGASITVDEPSNAVMIRAGGDVIDSIVETIARLDVASDEAFCDAWMLFVRGDKVRDFEASISFVDGGFSMDAAASFSSDGFGVALPAGNLKANLQVMASKGLVEVVDRPQLRLSSGHRSEVSTGDEVPFPVTTFRDGIASTSIEFKRVGLTFAVDPLFLGGGRVRMDVKAENGLLGAIQRIAGVDIPSISRQSVTSAATLGFDDAIVIGGLESARRERRFGLFGESEKVQVGRLYVCIMLRSGYPQAVPVIGPGAGLGINVPGALGDPGEFGTGLLPPKDWTAEQLDAEIDRMESRMRSRGSNTR